MDEGGLGELMSDVIENSVPGRIEGETGTTRVVAVSATLQLIAEAYQAGMNYAFERAAQLKTES